MTKINQLPRHVIWDWNGTLLDDTWLCVDVINEVLAARNLPQVTREQHQELFDFPVIEYYRRLGFDLEAETFEVVGDEFMRQYEARKFESRLFDDALPLMKRMRSMGVGQSVLSAYQHDYLMDILRHFHLTDYLDHILGSGDQYGRGKKDQAKELIEHLNVQPQDVLLIGDTAHDYEVAESVGMSCCLVTTGSHPRSKLLRTGAEVYDCLTDVFAACWEQE